MKLEQINEQAKESLRKYFKDAYDTTTHESKKELTYQEMMEMIHRDIQREEERLNELNMIKSVLEHDAKSVYEYYFGSVRENEEVHHDTVNEMRAKLNENMANQFAYVNELKQKRL